MTAAASKFASAYNLNTEVSTVTIPFVGTTNDCICVFVAIRSGTASVASVSDDNTSNAYTCKSSVSAREEVDYSQGGLSKLPYFHNTVAVEGWAVKSAGAVTKITVTLTRGAKFDVIVQSYTSGSAFGVSSSATAVLSSAPSVGLLTTAANSTVVAGIACTQLLDQSVTTGTLRGTVSYGGSSGTDKAVQLIVGDNTSASLVTTKVATAPNTTDNVTLDGVTFAQPATYAMVAIEIKA